MTIRTVSVKLTAQVTDYMAKIGQARAATGQLMGELDKLGKNSPEKFNKLTMGMAGAGLGLTAFAGIAIKTAATFDKEMSAVGAVVTATADQMDQLRQAALDAGKATIFSASESAKAEEELAKAGISVKDILGGGLTGALSLAAAGQMDLADAATIAAQAMNVFHLSGAAVPHIADVLAAAANKSAADMHDLGDALRQGGLVANQAGLSLEETTGTLAAFADRALIGSDAGTSLKSMLSQLAAPSAKSAGLMKELGLNIYDTQGKFIGITKFAGLLQTQLGGLTQKERDFALAQIFGTDAMRSANVLYSLGEKGLRDYIDAVDDTGAANETARKKTDNLAGDIERLKGSLETLFIQAGSGANGGMRTLVKAADGLVSAFSALPGPVKSSAVVLAGLSGVALLAGAGFLKARQTVQELVAALEEAGPMGVRAAAGLRSIGGVVGKLGLAGAAVGGVWMGLQALSDWAERKHAPVKADIDKLTASLKNFAATGKIAGELAAKYGQNLSIIGKDAESVVKGQQNLAAVIKDVQSGLTAAEAVENYNPIDPNAQQRIEDLDAALSNLVNNGGAVQASLALQKLRDAGSMTSAQYDDLLTLLPHYAEATRSAATANSQLAQGFADTSAKASLLNSSLSDQIAKGETLIDVWKQLNGAVLDSDQAMLDANKALDDVKKSFTDNGKAIEGNTTKALSNRVAVEKAAEAAAKAAQAKFQETGSVTEATAVYDGYIAKLRTTLMGILHNKGAVDALIASVAKMPPAVTVPVSMPGLQAGLDRVRVLGQNLANLPDYKTIKITTYDKQVTLHGDHAYRWGGITTHAAAGSLRDASIYSAVPSGARYAFAEPATGGEAFIPKNGDYGRSMSILSEAARWYGASVMPRGASGMGGGTPVIVNVYATAPNGNGLTRELINTIQYTVRTVGGGDVNYLAGRR